MVPAIVFLFIPLSETNAQTEIPQIDNGQSQNSGSWMEHPTKYQNSGTKETRQPNQLEQNDHFQLKANNFRMEVTGGEGLRPPVSSDDNRSQELDNLSQPTKKENIPEQSESEFISVLLIVYYKCLKQEISLFKQLRLTKLFLLFLCSSQSYKIS